MNTKVNLMAAGGTAAVAVSKPAVKTDCQKDAFSKTLDEAQQAREQKAARTDDTAKDHEGKAVKPEDKAADAPEKAEDGGKEAPALMPVSHTSQQAQIRVVVDGQGNFVRAELLPPKTQLPRL